MIDFKGNYDNGEGAATYTGSEILGCFPVMRGGKQGDTRTLELSRPVARAFVRFMSGARLLDRSHEDIEAFLADAANPSSAVKNFMVYDFR